MAKVNEDGNYFEGVAKIHESKLIKLLMVSENFLCKATILPEEYKGLIKSAVGKTKLLVDQKIKQFYGLCHTNMNPNKELPITSNDLAGFWDLIMIEVRLLYKNFKYIADCAKDNWKKPLEEIEIIEVKGEQKIPKLRKTYPDVKSVIGPQIKKLKNQGSQQKSQDEIEILWQNCKDTRKSC